MVLANVCFFLCFARDIDPNVAFFQLRNSADLLGTRLAEEKNRAHPNLVSELGKVTGWLEMLILQKEQEESLAFTPSKQKAPRMRSNDEDSDRDGVFERQEDGSQSSRPSSSGSASNSSDDSFTLSHGELSPEVTPHQTPKKILFEDKKISDGTPPPSLSLCAATVQGNAELPSQTEHEISPAQREQLMRDFAASGWNFRGIQKLAIAGPLRGGVWEEVHELFAQGRSSSQLVSLLRLYKITLSTNSFLDEKMKRHFEFLPPVVAQHARKALEFICSLFSQAEFSAIFGEIAPSLLENLEMMDNSSRDGGCQDRALFFTNFVLIYQSHLHEKSYESIPAVARNFVVLNYLLGCCQKRFGKDSFLNYPFPEQTETFRVDPWLKNCISPERLQFLSEKNMSGPAAQIAAAVSVLNKLWFMSQSQLEMLTCAQSFAVEIAKATHKSSFDTMFKFLEANPQVPIDVIWTHMRPDSTRDGVVQATYSGNSFEQESLEPSHPRYVMQLFSFNLTAAEARAVEDRMKTKSDLFEFMGAWAACTDLGQYDKEAFSKSSILFSNGILNRTAAREKAKESKKLVGVGHIYATSAAKTLAQLLASYSTEDDLGKTFVQ